MGFPVSKPVNSRASQVQAKVHSARKKEVKAQTRKIKTMSKAPQALVKGKKGVKAATKAVAKSKAKSAVKAKPAVKPVAKPVTKKVTKSARGVSVKVPSKKIG